MHKAARQASQASKASKAFNNSELAPYHTLLALLA
jgi:hypothetical protein